MNEFDVVLKELEVLGEVEKVRTGLQIQTLMMRVFRSAEDLENDLWFKGGQKDADLDKLAKLRQEYHKQARKVVTIAMKKR